MSANPYESPETVGYVAPPKINWSKLVLRLLVGAAIVAVLIALLLPLRRNAPEAARRMQCTNHLKIIALALQNYESTYHCFPPAYTVDAAGKPLHSWRTLILPFIEGQQALYEQIDLSKPWDDPANRAAASASMSVYHCPSAHTNRDKTTYLAIAAPGGLFEPPQSRGRAAITDHPGLTLMVIEVSAEQAVPWMSPSDASEELILNLGSARRPPHVTGIVAAFIDGHTQFLPRHISPAILRALISIAGDDDAVAKEL